MALERPVRLEPERKGKSHMGHLKGLAEDGTVHIHYPNHVTEMLDIAEDFYQAETS